VAGSMRVMAEPTKVKIGAGDEDRTRDIQLGRLTLCQLSYSRPVRAQADSITDVGGRLSAVNPVAQRTDSAITRAAGRCSGFDA
jgi:hypothetical protein